LNLNFIPLLFTGGLFFTPVLLQACRDISLARDESEDQKEGKSYRIAVWMAKRFHEKDVVSNSHSLPCHIRRK
jgi:hypothetical protein